MARHMHVWRDVLSKVESYTTMFSFCLRMFTMYDLLLASAACGSLSGVNILCRFQTSSNLL